MRTIIALLAITLVAPGCKKLGGGNGIVVELAKSTYTKAKAEFDKGSFDGARDTCKLIDKAGLEKEEGDDAKKLLSDINLLCDVDITASRDKADIDKAYKEFQTTLATDPSFAQYKVSSVESSCTSAKSNADLFYKDVPGANDRPSVKALNASMAQACTPEAVSFDHRIVTGKIPEKTAPKAASGTCTLTLRVAGFTPSNPACVLNEKVRANSPTTVSFPCAGGPATARFGTQAFTGTASSTHISLTNVSTYPLNGCTYKSVQTISGAPPNLTYTYAESIASGSCKQSGLCTAKATFSAQ